MANAGDRNTKAHWTIANQLLVHMIVQETVLPKLQTDAYRAYSDIIPEIERAIGEDDMAADLLRQLGDICATSNLKAFQEAARLAGEIQQILFTKGGAGSHQLCKRLVAIESTYCDKHREALLARMEQSGNRDGKSAEAQNTKEFDKGGVAKFIADTFPAESGVKIADANFISGGYSKYTVGLKLAGQKSLPADIILRGDAGGMFGGVSVVDEYRLLVTMHEHGVCVPRPLALEKTGQVFGSPFILVEKSPGGVIGHMFALPPPNPALNRDIAAKLAKIHGIPLGALDGKVEGADTSTRRKVLAWLDEAQAKWKPLNMPSSTYELAFQWLRDNVEISEKAPRGLVHADFGLNNLLIEGDRVSAILDWEFAHIGNPAYDLGYFYFMAKSLGPWEEFLQAYAEAGGIVPDQRQLDYQILLAATRLGTMLCQTVATYYAGETALGVLGATGGGFYNVAVLRIAETLDRVM